MNDLKGITSKLKLYSMILEPFRQYFLYAVAAKIENDEKLTLQEITLLGQALRDLMEITDEDTQIKRSSVAKLYAITTEFFDGE